VGRNVLRLRRVRYGPIRLGDLAEGSWRRLQAPEIEALQRATRANDESSE
jgi:23S rRNA pseudouridine2605 synthase